MNIKHTAQVPAAVVDMPGASGCRVRWLVAQSDGAPTFAMRQFEVAPGGFTPKHSHDFEHEIFVLEGAGVALEGDQQHPLAAGDVIFVRPGETHQFRNTGAAPLKFLCMIPNSAMGKYVTMAPGESC